MKPQSAKVKYKQAKTPWEYIIQRVSINTQGECWEWAGPKDKDGYGQVQHSKVGKDFGVTRAHQLAWVMQNGKIPNGLFVCHKCDKPSCVNPKHLFLGTALDNNKDMNNKGRGVRGMLGKGINQDYVCSQHGIKDSMTLAEELGVTFSNICHIWRKHGLKGRRHFARTT